MDGDSDVEPDGAGRIEEPAARADRSKPEAVRQLPGGRRSQRCSHRGRSDRQRRNEQSVVPDRGQEQDPDQDLAEKADREDQHGKVGKTEGPDPEEGQVEQGCAVGG